MMELIPRTDALLPLASIRTGFFARLFRGKRRVDQVVLYQHTLRVFCADRVDQLPLRILRSVSLRSGWFWSRITVEATDSEAVTEIVDLPKRQARVFTRLVIQERKRIKRLCDELSAQSVRLQCAANWIAQGEEGQHWVAQHALMVVIKDTDALKELLELPPIALTDDTDLALMLEAIVRFRIDPASFRQHANRCFVDRELIRYRDLFDNAEKHPLTLEQRLAVVTHEDNTRVIAAAGSGKTSVLAVKAAYLLKKGLCRPEQLLLVAFNWRAAKELSERAEHIAGMPVNAFTFHSLGLSIIGRATGRKPTLSNTATDDTLLRSHLRDLIADVILDPKAASAVRRYFQSFFAPYRSQTEFKELGEYYDYVQAFELRSLNGVILRSFEEVEIANFLFLNGIDYRYEAPYEVDLATAEHRQYQPDFYLPTYSIYIEHFGIGRDGSTAPYVDRDTYHEQMEWKRAVHAEHKTTLIETYSYFKQEGRLTEVLAELLTGHGVELRPINNEELLEALQSSRQLDPFSDLTATFLNHFKGNGLSINQVSAQARQRSCDSPRLQAFLGVFEPVYERYQHALSDAQEIDFNDMIIEAARLVNDGAYRSPYTCILVDEFQDISVGRAKLIQGLADQAPSHRLFCVGDDWQAIYRFAGSDIALMRDFHKHFGFTETVRLGHTFRFNNRIADVASRFVQRNPSQLAKSVTCQTKAKGPKVYLHRAKKKEQEPFLAVMEAIVKGAGSGQHSVMVLGRYRKSADGWPWAEARRRFPMLDFMASTVHAAKGSEADYVVVVDLIAGRYGFPAEISDDPLLDPVLSEAEAFAHAEERRLFYVALTRARHAVHLLADPMRPSVFVAELASDHDGVEALEVGTAVIVHCPLCGTGTLIRRTGRNGDFYGCSHYPLCNHIAAVCRHCNEGAFVRREADGAYLCSNTACGHRERICPRCGAGRLTERHGRYGPFFGCSNYAKGLCNYTEPVSI